MKGPLQMKDKIVDTAKHEAYIVKRHESGTIELFDGLVRVKPARSTLMEIAKTLDIPLTFKSGSSKTTRVLGKDIIQKINGKPIHADNLTARTRDAAIETVEATGMDIRLVESHPQMIFEIDGKRCLSKVASKGGLMVSAEGTDPDQSPIIGFTGKDNFTHVFIAWAKEEGARVSAYIAPRDAVENAIRSIHRRWVNEKPTHRSNKTWVLTDVPKQFAQYRVGGATDAPVAPMGIENARKAIATHLGVKPEQIRISVDY